MDENAVDVARMAEILGVSTATLYGLARRGDIPAIKLGGVWRFFPSKVIAHLERPKDPWQQSARSRARRRVG